MRMAKRNTVGIVVLLFCAIALGVSTHADDQNPLVGTWKLVSAQIERPDDKPDQLYGPSPSGLLIYDSSGYMSVHLMRPGLPKVASADRWNVTPEEAKILYEGYLGYWGRYKVDSTKETVTHMVEGSSFPNYAGTEQKRSYELAGRRIVIKNHGPHNNQFPFAGVFVWERIN
jgi:hypothetical protein